MAPPDSTASGALPPLSLYIHVPWCVKKCPYCDFNSHALTGDIPEDGYLDAIMEDLAGDLALIQGRPIQTVFIGGGTPSLMSPDFYNTLFDRLRTHLSFTDTAEITLEANPGTVEQARFNGFLGAGINRLSLGIQSFNPKRLKALGRIHDDKAAHKAIEAARNAGFDNFNLDLMHGLPDQTPAEALDDLQAAMSWQPPHLSWYQLTLEPNTEFYSRPPQLPDDDYLWEIYCQGADYLHQQGFTDYEVSAWSRPGMESRHNLNYWMFGDYLALGAGAHGKVTFRNGDIRRFWKTRQPEAYMNRIGSRTSGSQMVEPEERPLEFLMNALRLTSGVPENLFTERAGLPLARVAVKLEELRKENMLEPGRIQTTELGQRYLNSLLERFL